MKTEVSFPCSPDTPACPYPTSKQFSLRPSSSFITPFKSSNFRSSDQNVYAVFLPIHTCHMPLLSQCSWYDHHTNFIWRVQFMQFCAVSFHSGRPQWPRDQRRGTAAARLLGLLVRIPLGTWIFVSCECCVLLCRGPWIRLITRPEESYRVWCVWVCSWSLDNEKALAH